MKKTVNINDFQQIAPCGTCKMGATDVTYYRTSGGRLWFDKLQIEYVLTGKNQHNLLGQYKDARNHGIFFDTERKMLVDVINKTGVTNYLKKAWSVKDENRHDFYAGVRSIENPRGKKISEPLQIPMFNTEVKVNVNPFVKISENGGQYTIDYTIDGNNANEKRQNLAKMLIMAANSVLNGNSQSVKLKEIA